MSRRAVVDDRAAHALNGLLSAMAGFGLLGFVDLPEGRLASVPGPVTLGLFFDRIPARLVLPMIVAAPDGKVVLSPYDLAPNGKPDGFD